MNRLNPLTVPDKSLPTLLQPEGQRLWLRVAVGVAFIVVVGLSVLRVVRTLDTPGAPAEHTQGLVDFHNAVYYPALAYWQGFNPYSTAYAEAFPVNRQYPLYSPATLWLHLPFALMPLHVANVIYFVFSLSLVIALAASVLYVCRMPMSFVNVFGLATLVLVSRPGHINLMLGQVTLPLALGMLWAVELARSRPRLAGLALAVTTLKPTFGVPLVWLMFCRRDFRAVAVGVGIGGAAALAGAAPIIASVGLRPLMESLLGSQSLHEVDPVIVATTSWTRLDALSVVGRFLGTQPDASAELIVTAACLLVAGAAVFRTSFHVQGERSDSLSYLIIASATLACIYHTMYDALVLVLPWVALMLGRLRTQVPGWAVPVTWLLLALPAVNYFSTRTFLTRFGLEGPTWTIITSLNGLAVIAVLVLSVSLALRPVARREPVGSPMPA